jgi:uncharacterized protein YjbI with pentapeptide repeats
MNLRYVGFLNLPLILGVIAGLVVVLAVFLWWWLPKWQVNHLRLTIYDPKAWADVEDNFRKTIGQLLVGAMVLGGAGLAATVAYRQLMSQQQASHDLLISIQVSKGFEQLGSDKVAVRLGGIYALEGVMNTSEQYNQAVVETLSAFVRDATKNETGDGPPMSDIQAALTVIARRVPIAWGMPNLANAHIPKAYLRGPFVYSSMGEDDDPEFSHMTSDGLPRGGELGGADLRGTDLRGADLSGADLVSADMTDANLSGALLFRANLTAAQLSGTNLSGALLVDSNLSHTLLLGTNLSGADLDGGKPQNSAKLRGAHLFKVDLSGAAVRQSQLDETCGTDVKLDPGLTLKPCSTSPPAR